ncbi:MAG TPA: hypothetical protein ENI60_07750 [Candidatus Fraserbacteria bacterium]|mgnify:CR=1 FL=1|nr:hypothetical protein [Candidatus Fraserbacteria bacterium]
MAIKGAATIQYLTQDELRRLLAAVSNCRDLAIIYTAYRYGLRASEVGFEETGGDSQKRRCGSSITLESKVRTGKPLLNCSGLSPGRAGAMVC